MKRTFVYNPETKQMEEKSTLRGERFHYVMGDVKPFVSPVSGEVIQDRGQLRRHMKANDLVTFDDAKGVAERARRERATREKVERTRAVVEAYEHRRNAEIAKRRFG